MEQSRRNSGAAMEANRRASGAANEASRRGQTVADDLNRLVNPPAQRRTLPAVQPVGAQPATQGRGTYVPPPAPGTGGGIASPLVETDAAQREYYDSVLLPTTDGLAWARFRSVKRIVMADANGAEVIQEFKNAVS
ncbi:hypothetical protein DN820_01760 [Stutzerimonas nosocomialis]|uniref:Uncharacterized protein n=2 Tax=Stutzerimonas nosocomialis TaxID=1056496 RepID=A0A5R9QJG4_9GAMM|nr:hypothetical protein DN820_01760 [Stutzerimonas nosocomialis]